MATKKKRKAARRRKPTPSAKRDSNSFAGPKRCERDGVYEECCWLREGHIEPDVADRLPMEQPTNIQTRPLRMSDQDDRIRAVFGLTSDDPLPDSTYENFCRYHDYLTAQLTFPFQAAYWEKTGPFESKQCKVKVVGLVDLESYCHEDEGLLFQIEPRGERTTVIRRQAPSRSRLWGILLEILGWSTAAVEEEEPDDCVALSDLELPKNDTNRRLLRDFDYWLWNH